MEDARRLVDEVLNALLTFMSSTEMDLRSNPKILGTHRSSRSAQDVATRTEQQYFLEYAEIPSGHRHDARDARRDSDTTLEGSHRPEPRYVMADACVLVTQIVARALIARGVKGVSVGECLFRVNDSMDDARASRTQTEAGYRLLHVVTDRSAEGLGKVLAHSPSRRGIRRRPLAPALGNGRSNPPFVWSDDLRERQHPENTARTPTGGRPRRIIRTSCWSTASTNSSKCWCFQIFSRTSNTRKVYSYTACVAPWTPSSRLSPAS